jgi:hypothetical protein
LTGVLWKISFFCVTFFHPSPHHAATLAPLVPWSPLVKDSLDNASCAAAMLRLPFLHLSNVAATHGLRFSAANVCS